MAYIFDEAAGGYRLVCEATGVQSDVVSTEESAVIGISWYCSDPAAEEKYLADQRARMKARLVELGMTPEEAEDEVAPLRWDTMPDGRVIAEPSAQAFADAEVPFPELQQKARVTFAADKEQFAADGADELTITLAGLVADATVDLGGGLSVAVTQVDPSIVLTSDIPRLFTVRLVDANHYSRPLLVRAV